MCKSLSFIQLTFSAASFPASAWRQYFLYSWARPIIASFLTRHLRGKKWKGDGEVVLVNKYQTYTKYSEDVEAWKTKWPHSDLLYLDTSKAEKCCLKPLNENFWSLHKGFLPCAMQIKYCLYRGIQYSAVLSEENLGTSQY